MLHHGGQHNFRLLQMLIAHLKRDQIANRLGQAGPQIASSRDAPYFRHIPGTKGPHRASRAPMSGIHLLASVRSCCKT